MMTYSRSTQKKFFTVAEANAMLPLLRSILRDITELAHQLRDRRELVMRLRESSSLSPGDAYNEELEQVETDFQAGQLRMEELEGELAVLGVELKDPFTGLVDFPHLHENEEVYLCWRADEPTVGHWHELDAGFAGRQKLVPGLAKTP